MSKHFFVTTPIYYVNAAPHLGTAYTTIAADAIARYKRFCGYDVSFVTGLDEHGQKIAETAEKNGCTPQTWCDELTPAFKDCWDMLDISYTDFVRTSSDAQTKSVQEFWQKLYDAGYLYKDSYDGWYCIHEETYYAESDLEKNEDGEYVCPECKRPVKRASGEENWFFKLSDFSDKLLQFYTENPRFIRPETRRNEIVSFVKSGLKDLSISRSTFDWGVPYTFDEGHVAYVWADALIAYLTGIGYADETRTSEFEEMWPADFHIVGKDITRFHCVIWPAMLMAAGLPLPKCVFGHGFLLTKGEKMSKSKGNALKPKDIVDIFGVDFYRYYFLSDVNFGADGSISMEHMVQVYNSDLANTYGNLVSRALNMTKKYFDSVVPSPSVDSSNNPLAEIAKDLPEKVEASLDNLDFSGAVEAINVLTHRANLYIEETEPWNIAKDVNREQELKDVIYNILEAIRIVAKLYACFMPNTSEDVVRRLGVLNDFSDFSSALHWGGLTPGNKIEVGEPLFPRLDIEKINLIEE